MIMPSAPPHTGPAATATPPASPMSAAYSAVASVLGHLTITEAEPPRSGNGWIRGSDLAEDATILSEFLTACRARTERDLGQEARPHVMAGFALHRYAWPAAVLTALPHFLLRRVPHLSPGDLALHPESGGITVRPTAFSCLPDDPAAAGSHAHVVPDEAALRDELRGVYADHLRPLFTAFRPHMRRGWRALWGMATDELAESVWYVGKLLGEESRARAEIGLLLPGATAPYTGGAGFRELAMQDGRRLPTRDRMSCCLYYTLRPENTCVTCPRTSDLLRVERLTEIERGSDTTS